MSSRVRTNLRAFEWLSDRILEARARHSLDAAPTNEICVMGRERETEIPINLTRSLARSLAWRPSNFLGMLKNFCVLLGSEKICSFALASLLACLLACGQVTR